MKKNQNTIHEITNETLQEISKKYLDDNSQDKIFFIEGKFKEFEKNIRNFLYITT